MVTTPIKLTFEEYLNYDDGTDNCYELFEEGLVTLPPESFQNLRHATFIGRRFETFVGMVRVILQGLELAVPRLPQMPLNRRPDLTVIQPEHISLMGRLGKAAITLDMPPPLLVAEIVSPYSSEQNNSYQRDYIEKRQQYAARGIIEYWIVDPQIQQVTVLKLVNGEYQATVFTGEQAIVSDVFPQLKLTAAEVFEQ